MRHAQQGSFWDSYTRWQRAKLTGSGGGLRV